MKYYFSKILTDKSFEETEKQVTGLLKEQGFGVLTEIDVKNTFKNKLDVDFKKYKVLGACNPQFAYQALQTEDKSGVFLPCNIVIEEHENGSVEVSAVSPLASMLAVENSNLKPILAEVETRLKSVVNQLA